MRVILSEEQIKRVLFNRVLNEEEVAQDAVQSSVINDPITSIRDASKKINNILSTASGRYYADEDQPITGNVGTNQNWLGSVKQTFNQYKSEFGNQYNQGMSNGNDRADCSGFVFSALRNAGYNVGVGNTDTMVNSPAFTNAISRGFRRINWHGPADASKLPPGTILAYASGENNKRYGHTLILGANGTSYDYGKNAHTEYSPNLNQTYTAAWVPIV